jgi:hypothetical protein
MPGPSRHLNINDGWTLALEEAAPWQETVLHPPGTPISAIRPTPPGWGWGERPNAVTVNLPATTDSVAAGYRGVSWWRREVVVEGDADVRLHFQGVRLLAEVYWDGELVGYDLDGLTPFEVAIPRQLSGAGHHRIDLRITNPGGSDNWEDLLPIQWAGRFLPSSQDFGGPWLPVTLEESRGARIADLWVRPDADCNAALVDAWVEMTRAGTLTLTLLDPAGSEVAAERMAAPAGVHRLRIRLPVDSPQRYAPGAPHLYQFRAVVTAGAASDSREGRFGFRLLDWMPGGGLLLNGAPFYLRTSISWGLYPAGVLATPADIAAEIDSIAAFGQNAVSAHRRLATPALLDALETRGFLLHQEPGGLPGLRRRDTQDWLAPEHLGFALALAEDRVRRLARRDRSRACLAWWNLCNEVFDAGSGDPGAPAWRLLHALREEDDSRLSTWTSGWGPTPMFRPYRAAPLRSSDFHAVHNFPSCWHPQVEAEVAAMAPPAAMLMLAGESQNFCGLGGLPEQARQAPPLGPGASVAAGLTRALVAGLEAGLAAIDPSGRLGGVEGFCAATAAVQAHGVTRLVEAHRANPAIHGLAINGWHSHPNIGAMGMTRLDRRPAFDPAPIARANAPMALVFQGIAPEIAVSDSQGGARLVLVSDEALPAGTAVGLNLLLRGPDGAVLKAWSERRVVGADPAGGRVHELGPITCEAPRSGALSLEAVADIAGNRVAAESSFLSCEPPIAPARPFALHDSLGDLAPWLHAQGHATQPWKMGKPGPMIANGGNLRTLHTVFWGEPRRSVVFLRGGERSREASRYGHLVRVGLAEPDARLFEIWGSWIGGWCFTLDASSLPSLGRPGVWDWARAATMPNRAMQGLNGRVLAGACSFPDATLFHLGVPQFGATASVVEQDGHQALFTTLPLVERLHDSPLAARLMSELIEWVTA